MRSTFQNVEEESQQKATKHVVISYLIHCMNNVSLDMLMYIDSKNKSKKVRSRNRIRIGQWVGLEM